MNISNTVYENIVQEFYDNGKDHRNYKYLFQGLVEEAKEVENCNTENDLIYELGDVLWYVTMIARTKGWTLNDIMHKNIIKLEDRVLNGKNT